MAYPRKLRSDFSATNMSLATGQALVQHQRFLARQGVHTFPRCGPSALDFRTASTFHLPARYVPNEDEAWAALSTDKSPSGTRAHLDKLSRGCCDEDALRLAEWVDKVGPWIPTTQTSSHPPISSSATLSIWIANDRQSLPLPKLTL
jgi:hypothetical protein